jgi:hypothetical protein
MKRTRSDSAAAAVDAARSARLPVEPPAHVTLRDGDRPFWDSVVCARARDTWTAADLENAANLARCKADIERLQSEITGEGDIIVNDRGTQIINPKHTLLETLSRRAVALSRMLHVHAEATVGESRDAGKALKTEKEAKQAASDDDLIPRLHAVK